MILILSDNCNSSCPTDIPTCALAGRQVELRNGGKGVDRMWQPIVDT